MPPNAQLVAGAQFAGRFKIVQVLGGGKTGTTYSADPLPSGERCALKVMRASLVATGPLRGAFRPEAMRAARARSAHLVRVVDAGVDEPTGQPWLASELIKGSDLAARVHLWGRLPAEDVERLIKAVGAGLRAGLGIGLVHYDLTPRCIHLPEGGAGNVKVRELGLSRFIAQARANEGEPVLSPAWMSPEQMSSQTQPASTANVWSLGLIAFYALTGKSYWLHAEGDPQALMNEVTSDPIEPASARAKRLGSDGVLPEWFDAWFARCVARNPRERYAEAGMAAMEWNAVGTLSEEDQRPTVPLDDDE